MHYNRRKKIIILIFLTMSLYQIVYGDVIKIASANLFAGNVDKEKTVNELLKLDADIIILLEWTEKNLDRNKLNDYHFIVDSPRYGTRGIAVLAKKTINARGQIIENPVKSPCAMPFATVSFTINSKNITVMAIHPPPPIDACEKATEKTIRAVQKWIRDGRLKMDIGSGKKGGLSGSCWRLKLLLL